MVVAAVVVGVSLIGGALLISLGLMRVAQAVEDLALAAAIRREDMRD